MNEIFLRNISGYFLHFGNYLEVTTCMLPANKVQVCVILLNC
jgi:hypothetical protein